MKKLQMILVIAGVFILVAACGKLGAGNKKEAKEQDSYSQIEKNGKLVVGLDDTFAPMSYRDNNGDIVGFDVDLAKAVGEKLDLKLEFQAIDWAMKKQN